MSNSPHKSDPCVKHTLLNAKMVKLVLQGALTHVLASSPILPYDVCNKIIPSQPCCGEAKTNK